jgi:hypothetical protein
MIPILNERNRDDEGTEEAKRRRKRLRSEEGKDLGKNSKPNNPRFSQ